MGVQDRETMAERFWSRLGARRAPARAAAAPPAGPRAPRSDRSAAASSSPDRAPRFDDVVHFHERDSHTLIAAIPVRAGQTASTRFPLGTQRSEVVRPVEFTRTGEQWMGHRIELDKGFLGNMGTGLEWRG